MSSNQNIQLTPRVLNGKTYSIGVSLFNKQLGYYFCILDNMLQAIRIDNDLDSFYPKCSIIFQDIGGKYTSLYKHFGQYMEIVIVSPTETQKLSKNTTKLHLICRVTEHKLLTYDIRKPQYEISGVLFYESSFNQHLNYATDKNYSAKSPYFLIKNILSKISIDIKYKIPSCNRAIHFISDQNKRVSDHIRYCLMAGASPNDPPAYLYYHLISKQFLIVNRDSLYIQPNYSCNYELIIPTDNGNKKVNNSLIVYNINAYSTLNSQQFYQQASLQDRWIYDHINRKWTYTEIKPQRYQQLLSLDKKNENKIKTSFDIKTFQQSNIRLYTTNYEYNIYARLHNLQVGSNCLQFYVEGNIVRDCGQTIKIECMNNNFKNIYGRYMANIQCITFNIG